MIAECVLLLGRDRDAELVALASILRRAGLPVFRLTVESLAAQRLAGRPLTYDPTGHVLSVAGRAVRPVVVWARHLPRPTGTGPAGQAERAFADDSWTGLLRQLSDLVPARLPGHAPESLAQLRQAAALGVRVPESLVATGPGDLPPAWRAVVVKALDRHLIEDATGAITWFHPRTWQRHRAAPWPWPGLPALVQEYVVHEAEFRVYVVAGQVLAYQISKTDPADLWDRPGDVTVRAGGAPAAVVGVASRLAEHWDLRYGAFDILVDRGEPVFLEVNSDGDWRWCEALAGDRAVTTCAGRALAELYRAGRSNGAAAGGDRVDPMLFLAA
jgi:hypothetical protein